ncbi:MAG: hypothetical protein PVJ02_03560 [Gemmatimonadota bacterium]|jgi:hypothetical protein
MRPASVLRGAITAVGAALLSGCYSYVPVQRPQPGTTVRIHVPARQADIGRSRNAEPETLDFEGRVVSFGDTLLLETESRREFGPFHEVFQYDTLRVAPQNLAGIEERYLSKPKTYGFAALVTVGAVGLAIAALKVATGSGGSGSPGGGNTQGDIILKPIFSTLLGALGR